MRVGIHRVRASIDQGHLCVRLSSVGEKFDTLL